ERARERGHDREQGGTEDEVHAADPFPVSSRFNAARARRRVSTAVTMLRRGDASSETRKSANKVSTMSGPVGTLPSTMDRYAPTPLPSAPNTADSVTMPGNVRVHCLAAAGGVTTNATINTSPTALTPMTVAMTIVVNISVSIARALKPRTLLWSGSNVRSA